MRVLLTGAGGQVGQALQSLAPAEVELHALTRAELDIADEPAVRRAVARLAPGLIINAAAYTAVDRAESEPQQAALINAAGPGHLARAAQRLPGCRLLHLSTDYVFDGCAGRPYTPQDEPNPLNAYGRSKLEGERIVLRELPGRASVLRTAWVYASRGHNFMLTMLRLMRERGVVRVVSDQSGTPTAAVSIAEALWRLAVVPRTGGVLHWTDAGVASWYDFARAIAEEALVAGLLQSAATVEPICSAEYPTPARRPAHSVLDCSQTCARLGLTAVPWRERLRTTLQDLARANVAA